MDKMFFGSTFADGPAFSFVKIGNHLVVEVGNKTLFLSREDVNEVIKYITTFLRGENDNVSG